MSTTGSTAEKGAGPHLRRDVGFWGLLFVSLGSIIGSGWLLGALTAATLAGPASLVSWVLAAVMLAILALIHAELGASYPVVRRHGPLPALRVRAAGRVHGRLDGLAAGRHHRADRGRGDAVLRRPHLAGSTST